MLKCVSKHAKSVLMLKHDNNRILGNEKYCGDTSCGFFEYSQIFTSVTSAQRTCFRFNFRKHRWNKKGKSLDHQTLSVFSSTIITWSARARFVFLWSSRITALKALSWCSWILILSFPFSERILGHCGLPPLGVKIFSGFA